MNDDPIFFVVIGLIAVAFGGYNLYEKINNPKRFEKAVDTTAKFMGEKVSRIWQNISRIWFPIIRGIVSIILGTCF